MANKKNPNYKTREDLLKENKAYKKEQKRMDELEALVKQLLKEKVEEPKVSSVVESNNGDLVIGKIIEDRDFIEIPPNKKIKVTSLVNGILNLHPEDGIPKSAKYKFMYLGQSKMITNVDLEKIVLIYSSFARRGAFYIHSEDFLCSNGLHEYYKDILDLEGLMTLVNKQDNEIRAIYKKMNKYQQEAFIFYCIDQMNKGLLDMNKVPLLSHLWGRQLTDMVRDYGNLNTDTE